MNSYMLVIYLCRKYNVKF